jgi:hypothetical protein
MVVRGYHAGLFVLRQVCGTDADRLASRAIVRIFPRYRGSIDWRGSDLSSAIGRDSTMTEGLGAKDAPHAISDEDRAQEQDPFRGMGELERRASLAWVGENLTEVRRAAFGQRILYWSLGIGFVIGLAADVGGYLIKSSTTTGSLFGLVGDLLYTFGWALWTGVVVVVFLQIIPEVKRRQYTGALDAYEAALREEAGARSDEVSPDR